MSADQIDGRSPGKQKVSPLKVGVVVPIGVDRVAMGLTNDRPLAQPRIVDIEDADGGRGCKVVFSSIAPDARRPLAHFELGSFTDNGGVPGATDKHDICVSTAGGCTRSCDMCAVPKSSLGFERLLTADEIAAQVTTAISLRNFDNNLPNVVGLMGNGEPPDNVREVIPALRGLISQPDKTPIDRVTVSTIGENGRGLTALADAFADSEIPVKLQFSLHSANPDKRRQIIPGRRSFEAIMADVDSYAEITGRPVKVNVVLMEHPGGFTNATPQDAEELAALLQHASFSSGGSISRRLKLSAFNPITDADYTRPDEETRAIFVETLRANGITEIKTFQGSGIDIDPETGKGGFACGQLRNNTHQILLDFGKHNSYPRS